MSVLASLFCGFVFGCGLIVSGMIQPTKVLGFLDVFGISRRRLGPEPRSGDRSWPHGCRHRLCGGAKAAAPGREGKPVADKDRYRFIAPNRRASIRYRLGSRWIVSWTGGREPSDAITAGDRFRHRNGNRHANA